MSGRLKKYSFINAKLRSRLSKILDEDFIKQLVDSKSLIEAIELLKDTDFAGISEVYEKTGDLKFAELELLKKEISLYQEIKKYLEPELAAFVDALLLRYELEHVKNTVRIWFESSHKKRDIAGYTGYILRDEFKNIETDKIINASDIEALVGAFRSRSYYEIIKTNIFSLEKDKNLFAFEIALDVFYYENIFRKTELLFQPDMEIVKRLIGVEIDLQNITWIIRFNEFYKLGPAEAVKYIIPNGFKFKNKNSFSSASQVDPFAMIKSLTEGRYNSLKPLLNSQTSDVYSRLVLVERILEEIMMYEVRKVLLGQPFSIGIINAYFILKKSEIKKIMIILNAKYYEIENERIMSSL